MSCRTVCGSSNSSSSSGGGGSSSSRTAVGCLTEVGHRTSSCWTVCSAHGASALPQCLKSAVAATAAAAVAFETQNVKIQWLHIDLEAQPQGFAIADMC
jgi:hypothetical protein